MIGSFRAVAPVFRSLQCVRGATPLYKPYRYVPPHWVGFLRRFGLKTGMVFEGTTGVYERIYRFNSK